MIGHVKLVLERRDKTSLDVFWAERRKPRGIRQCQRTDVLTDEIAAPWLATARGQPRATAHGHTSVWGLLSPLRFANSGISGHGTFIFYLRTPAGNKSEQPAV